MYDHVFVQGKGSLQLPLLIGFTFTRNIDRASDTLREKNVRDDLDNPHLSYVLALPRCS